VRPEDTPPPASRLVPYDPGMPDHAPLSDELRAFLALPGRFLTLATVDPDGAPRQAVIWYRLDPDGRITINSADGRRWPANLRRDPRCSLSVADPADAYSFVALVGRVAEVIDEQAIAQADIADLAHRYHAHEPARAETSIARFKTQHRVTFRVAILAVHDHREG
jgi:PPOX class probable F420-dependent enzyme